MMIGSKIVSLDALLLIVHIAPDVCDYLCHLGLLQTKSFIISKRLVVMNLLLNIIGWHCKKKKKIV
jgi:hypothetical protein